MNRRFAIALLASTLFAAPALAQPAPAQPNTISRQERARFERIVRGTPLIDGHNDLPWAIRDDFGGDLSRVDLTTDTRRLTPALHTDIPRLRQGGVGAQFWSVYVPAELHGQESALAVREQIDLVRRIVERYPQRFAMAYTADDIVRIHRSGRIASMLGMEGGEPVDISLEQLRSFRRSGVLYMTLCHSKTTAWADSATDTPKHGGLSPFGESVVREMNRIGMLVDLSHVSADAMRDALRISTAPIIFSHSSAFATTAHPRNVPDDVLRSVRQNGGVVMVNFNAPFISQAMWEWSARRAAETARLTTLNPADTAAVTAGVRTWVAANPPPAVTSATLADHVEHIRDVAGIDAVGLGSDYDGVTYLPEGMGGVEGYPLLFAELMRRGWSDADLAKLAGGNLLRALRQAEQVATRGRV